MDLANKVCVVTGANSGIGKETVRILARRGAYVVMICRNRERAIRAKEEIVSETGHEKIEVMLADLAVQHHVREAASRIRDKFLKVDILINNAGIIPYKKKITIDGIEKTMAVNHLAPFLLTNLLLEPLKKAEDARVINVSSEVHRMGINNFDLANLQLEQSYSPMKAYSLSKLCNIMFTYELSKRCANTSITAVSLHPGFAQTKLAENASWIMKTFYFFGKHFMQSAKSSAQTIINLATSDEIASYNGKYFKKTKVSSPASIAYNDKYTKKLWEKSEILTGLS